MTTILLLLIALAMLIASVAGFAAHNAHQAADLALRKCEHLRTEIVRLEIAIRAQGDKT